jgi:outer membrane protein OmpA-like peptidoglycan-associated protein
VKQIIFLIFLLCHYAVARSQVSDTVVHAQGNIISATTKKPVDSNISYKSLPYGSVAGFFSGSTFNFPLFDNEKYELTVVAPGYAPSKYLLDPNEANSDRKVIKNVELSLPMSAVKIAEETHTVGKIMRLDNLIFDARTSKIESSSFEELDHVVKMLKDNPNMIIQLEGHTDFQGSPTANMKLSQDRVDAVKNYLTSKGASKNSIKTKAFGGTQPISREDTEEAHKLNRRVEVRVLEN